MLTSVQKIQEDRYLVNETVIICDMNFKETKVEYNVDYNSEEITEKEALNIAAEFIEKSVQNIENRNLYT